MLLRSQKFQYLFESARRYTEPVICPFCNTGKAKLIDRKYFVTRLFECNACHLYFRHPVEKQASNETFYQEGYVEDDNITTSLPTVEELEELKKDGFLVGNKNAARYCELFSALTKGKEQVRVIDYGCSWGYISWQLRHAGFDVESYEISKPRAAYGNKNLGLNILTQEKEIRPGNDIFFSSHVIEHHPSINEMISLAKSKLNNGGYFIAISPNGSNSYRKKDPAGFHLAWGKVHPNYLNVDFYKTIFKDFPYYIGSSPFNFPAIQAFNAEDQIIDDLASEELIVIAKF